MPISSRFDTSFPGGSRRLELLGIALLTGALFGLFVLRPMNDFVAWHEHEVDAASVWEYVWTEMRGALQGEKPSKTAFYAAIGSLFSLLAAGFYSSVHERNHRIDELTAELGRDLDPLIASGESEALEFKSTFRWDLKENRTNRTLENVVMKSLAGFLNNKRGGTLLIGVADDGQVIGLEHDYRSLKKPDRDGFEQALISAVAHHLGGDLSPYLQVVFHRTHDKEVCRVIIASAPRPVYLEQSGAPKLYLRSGTTTRELNVREAIDYQSSRWRR
jgi:hypothetical protein